MCSLSDASFAGVDMWGKNSFLIWKKYHIKVLKLMEHLGAAVMLLCIFVNAYPAFWKAGCHCFWMDGSSSTAISQMSFWAGWIGEQNLRDCRQGSPNWRVAGFSIVLWPCVGGFISFYEGFEFVVCSTEMPYWCSPLFQISQMEWG